MLVIWIPAFQNAATIPYNNTMPLYEFYARGANNLPFIHNYLAFLMIVVESILLNYILNKFEIMAKKTAMPAIFYCLLMSCCKPLTHFYPLLFSNFFILLALFKIGLSYRVEEAFSSIFDASFFIAISSLFYFPSIIIYPLIWVTLIVIRPFVWREWIISMIGLILPYVFVIVYYFWTDKVNFLLYDKIFFPSSDSLLTLSNQRPTFVAVASMLLLLMAFSILTLLKGWPVNTILSRNFLVVLFWLLGLSLLSYSMAPVFNITYLSIAAIPLSVFIANYFLMTKFKWISEIIFLLFLSAILFENYG
ncbi:MAG TPA: hypothetical protein PK323_12605 [Bacteroidia bacterium]|nr:hypothetical protein [Bacteroidia bacterium]